MLNVKGSMMSILSRQSHGTRHVRVLVQGYRTEKGVTVKAGDPVEGIGGFKHEKDFEPNLAERCALENAAAKVRLL